MPLLIILLYSAKRNSTKIKKYFKKIGVYDERSYV